MNLPRRRFLRSASYLTALAAMDWLLPLPAWALSNRRGLRAARVPGRYDLRIGHTDITIGGRRARATGINGTVPGPLLRFREGQRVTLNVENGLAEDSSLHWHGLLLPANMDGVPGISFAGIPPGGSYRYEYDLIQNGTYWYHSHSGLQEQTGVYGPVIIDPEGPDPVPYDSEFVLLLSDWTFDDPHAVLANLKKSSDYYNRNKRTLFDPSADRAMWARMRMDPTDVADVTAATYTYLVNGLDPAANWTAVFTPGDRVRLRIINGSAMTFFNVRIPELEMQVVQADGQNIEPVATDEFQIGTAETYDVIVRPADRAYTIFAESMDRSGFARGTLAPRAGLSAAVPSLRQRPQLSRADMGMAHGAMQREGPDHGMMEDETMHGGATDHGAMHHGAPQQGAMSENPGMGAAETPSAHDHAQGPGVDGVVALPQNRLDDPGLGLEDVPHRVLRYSDLRSRTPRPDATPQRTVELHLTGNMRRYMWSFDGLRFSEVDGPIVFRYGERLRMMLVNDTMMSHPIHLHGMFVSLVNGNGPHNPLKHTVVVKPAERLAVDITADAPGDWAFHCHLLYHMQAGMMRAVSVRKTTG